MAGHADGRALRLTSAATTTFLCDFVGTPTRKAMPGTWRPAKAPVPIIGNWVIMLAEFSVACPAFHEDMICPGEGGPRPD